SINNCYALGNVLADKTSSSAGDIHAGGLVGYISHPNDSSQPVCNVQYNFAAGSVTAQSVSGAVYAGGIVGYRSAPGTGGGGVIQNNAALGASVTAKGSSATRVAARIYGYPSTNIGSANYAKDSMRIEKSDVYGTLSFPYWDGVTPSSEPSTCYKLINTAVAADQNGVSVSSSVFNSSNIWTNASMLNFAAATPNPWNFTSVIGKGYPTLLNVGGQ
ncbi:hypothetical protein, partial [Treponema sp. R80B11-R83G3]